MSLLLQAATSHPDTLPFLQRLWSYFMLGATAIITEEATPLIGGLAAQSRRLDITPGITGLWQVLGRTDIPFDEMVKLDYIYVTNWSLWWDLKILGQTIPVVLSRRGAY